MTLAHPHPSVWTLLSMVDDDLIEKVRKYFAYRGCGRMEMLEVDRPWYRTGKTDFMTVFAAVTICKCSRYCRVLQTKYPWGQWGDTADLMLADMDTTQDIVTAVMQYIIAPELRQLKSQCSIHKYCEQTLAYDLSPFQYVTLAQTMKWSMELGLTIQSVYNTPTRTYNFDEEEQAHQAALMQASIENHIDTEEEEEEDYEDDMPELEDTDMIPA